MGVANGAVAPRGAPAPDFPVPRRAARHGAGRLAGLPRRGPRPRRAARGGPRVVRRAPGGPRAGRARRLRAFRGARAFVHAPDGAPLRRGPGTVERGPSPGRQGAGRARRPGAAERARRPPGRGGARFARLPPRRARRVVRARRARGRAGAVRPRLARRRSRAPALRRGVCGPARAPGRAARGRLRGRAVPLALRARGRGARRARAARPARARRRTRRVAPRGRHLARRVVVERVDVMERAALSRAARAGRGARRGRPRGTRLRRDAPLLLERAPAAAAAACAPRPRPRATANASPPSAPRGASTRRSIPGIPRPTRSITSTPARWACACCSSAASAIRFSTSTAWRRVTARVTRRRWRAGRSAGRPSRTASTRPRWARTRAGSTVSCAGRRRSSRVAPAPPAGRWAGPGPAPVRDGPRRRASLSRRGSRRARWA